MSSQRRAGPFGVQFGAGADRLARASRHSGRGAGVVPGSRSPPRRGAPARSCSLGRDFPSAEGPPHTGPAERCAPGARLSAGRLSSSSAPGGPKARTQVAWRRWGPAAPGGRAGAAPGEVAPRSRPALARGGCRWDVPDPTAGFCPGGCPRQPPACYRQPPGAGTFTPRRRNKHSSAGGSLF